MVRRLLSNLRFQKASNHPAVVVSEWSNAPLTRQHKSDKQVTNGVVGSKSEGTISTFLRTKTPRRLLGGYGAVTTIYQYGYASRACTQVTRNTERHLRLTEKLLGEQRRNLNELPIRDRQTGCQCSTRDSGPVVVDGVTTIQGVRESRTQGEGV